MTRQTKKTILYRLMDLEEYLYYVAAQKKIEKEKISLSALASQIGNQTIAKLMESSGSSMVQHTIGTGGKGSPWVSFMLKPEALAQTKDKQVMVLMAKCPFLVMFEMPNGTFVSAPSECSKTETEVVVLNNSYFIASCMVSIFKNPYKFPESLDDLSKSSSDYKQKDDSKIK